MIANKSNLGRLNGMKRAIARKQDAMLGAYREYATKIEGTKLKIKMKAGESGRLFGSVTNVMLADILTNMGMDIDRRIIVMPTEVKELGTYTANVKFHPEVEAGLEFEVVADDAEAAAVP